MSILKKWPSHFPIVKDRTMSRLNPGRFVCHAVIVVIAMVYAEFHNARAAQTVGSAGQETVSVNEASRLEVKEKFGTSGEATATQMFLANENQTGDSDQEIEELLEYNSSKSEEEEEVKTDEELMEEYIYDYLMELLNGADKGELAIEGLPTIHIEVLHEE